MRDVAIVGAGITPCRGRWVEKTYYGLAQMGVRAALEDAKISAQDVDAVVGRVAEVHDPAGRVRLKVKEIK